MSQDVIERNLYLFGDINSEGNVLEVIKDINFFNTEDEGKKEEDRTPINLYINSFGGDMSGAFSLISTIENSTTPIYAHALNEVFSAALSIFVSCHKRIAYKHSVFMFHSTSSTLHGDMTILQDQHDYSKSINERNIEIVKSYTDFSEDFLQNIIDRRKDHIFYYKEAYENKVVDELLIGTVYEDDIKYIDEKFPKTLTVDAEELITSIPPEELESLVKKYILKESVDTKEDVGLKEHICPHEQEMANRYKAIYEDTSETNT